MKKSLIILSCICLLVCVVLLFSFRHPGKKKTRNLVPEKGFAVVELFTSEGCSSCPPADEAVAALATDHTSNVFVLGFHVDYWNNLGWKDEFSSADYTSRQNDYAAALALNSTYTPQIIVNGKTEFTGSDKSLLYTTVEKELSTGNNTGIELAANSSGSGKIAVTYKTNAGNNSVLNIALVQLQANSAVKKGENKGKLLHHVDVVRNFKTVKGSTGSVTISLPSGLTAKDCKIIAFVQNKTDMHISGAGECLVQ